jgi:hypothetical protein
MADSNPETRTNGFFIATLPSFFHERQSAAAIRFAPGLDGAPKQTDNSKGRD